MNKTIDVSGTYIPPFGKQDISGNRHATGVEIKYSNPATVVNIAEDISNNVDFSKDDFTRILKKVARPVKRQGDQER